MLDYKSTYVQPTLPSSGYSFVAAGALFRSYAGYCVYVKYKPGTKNKITVKQQASNYCWFICPDRELLIVKNSNSADAFYPYGDSFDECVDFSIYNDYTSKGLNLEYIMTNYAHSSSTKNPRIESRTHPDNRIQMMSDSGGLQLIRGVKNLIHPKDLIEFYNNNVDAGMILDLPLHFSDMEMCKKLANLQRKNTDTMLKHNRGVDLINIFHGQTAEERRVYRSIVEDKRVPRVAIARVGHMKPITGVNAVCEVIEGSFRYKQYHVLGVYTSTQIPLLVKLANSGENPVHITSDSTSHIQSAITKTYHHQFDIYHTSKRLPIGNRGSIPSPNRLLPCQCKVCTTLKYTDILAFGANSTVLELLSIHNAYEMSRYARQLQEVHQNDPNEFSKVVKRQLSKNGQLKEVIGALDFIDIYSKYGLQAAQKKYVNHLNTMTLIPQSEGPGLFGSRDSQNAEAKIKLKRAKALYTEMLNQLG